MVIIIGLVLVLGLAVVLAYNGLVVSRNRTDNAVSQIDVQLKRRLDLIPNLVATVQGYASHERDTLTRVTEARGAASELAVAAHSGSLNPGRFAAEAELGRATRGLLAVAERYPDLKADRNFLELQEELTSTENRIAFARQFYNDCVLLYNTRIESFPLNLLAILFGFQRRDLFAAEDAADQPVAVRF